MLLLRLFFSWNSVVYYVFWQWDISIFTFLSECGGLNFKQHKLIYNLQLLILAVECRNYSSLTSGDRKTTYITKSSQCDSNLKGWYRFQGAAGTRMPTSCPPREMCNANAPGWLNGEHPTVADGKVTRQVCFHWYSNCCWRSTNIQVRNCGSFYVYHFSGTPSCYLRYCGSD